MTNTIFLRRALLIDAVMTGATGLLLMVGAQALAGLLALPAGLLFWAGLGLLPFALCVALLGRQEAPSRGAVLAVVLCNALWAIDSVLIIVLGVVDPNMLGIAFVVAQAVAVGVFAEMQFIGLRRAATVTV